MGNSDGGQAWGTIMLLRSEREALKLPLALLPPKKDLLAPAQPPSVTLTDLRQKSSPLWGSKQHLLCSHSHPQGARGAAGGLRRG